MNSPVLILYLEDNPRDAELVRDKLQQLAMPHELRIATGRAEYEAALAETRFDLIISDYALPDYDGFAALALAIEEQPGVPFILISGTLSDEQAVECLRRGATDYVIKQNLKRLVPAVMRALTEAGERQKRRAAETALKALASRQEAILAAIPDIIMEVDIHKVYTWANRVGVEFFGEDVIGKEAAFYFEGEEVVYRTVQPLFNGDENTICVESWQRRKDGEKRLLLWSCRVLKDLHGHVTGALSTARDITERRRVEAALQESSQMIEGIIDSMPVRVFWKDKNLAYLGCNAIFARDAGFAASKDLIGKDDLQLVWREQAEAYRADDRAVIESGRARLLIEESQTTPTGDTITLLTSKLPLRNSQGEITGLLGMYMDITERKRAETEIRNEQALSNAIIDSIPGTFYLLDEHGRYARWNTYQRDVILGKPEDQMAGMNAIDTIHPEDRALIQSRIANVLRDGKEETVEGRVLLRGGPAFIWMLMTGRRMTIAGRPFLVGTGIDITKRKATEQELQEAKTLTDAIVENIPLMVFLKDATDLRFVTFNRAGEELLGYDRKALLGKNNLDLFPPEQAANFMAKDREALAEQDMVDIPEEPIQTAKNGERLLHTRKVCIRGSDGATKYLLGISEDITERKRAEKEREQMQAQLIQAQKLESIGVLASGVAHEINNPIMGVMGYAQLIHDRWGAGDADLLEYATEIAKETDRVAMIVKNLLSFARQNEDIHGSPARIHDIVEATLSLIRAVLRHDQVTLEVHVPADLPEIRCRNQQIQQVIMNLVTNARDALNVRYPGLDAKKKKIIISARMIEKSVRSDQLSVISNQSAVISEQSDVGTDHCSLITDNSSSRHWLRLTVEDHGAGIPEDLRARIFEPFFTTKPRDKGTGLGLSISHGIVKDHGGELSVESEVGQWTRFHVDLPVVESVNSER